MNRLGRKVLKILENSPMGGLSVHFLSKQCDEMKIDLNSITSSDLSKLSGRMENILPFFIGRNAEGVIEKIQKLESDDINT